MAKNREASQFSSFVNANETNGKVGIANSVGRNTTTPRGGHALYVQGTANVTGAINSDTDVQVGGVSITATASGDATARAIALG